MLFNIRKFNSGRLYGKYINLSQVGLRSEIYTSIRPIQCIANGEENPQNCLFHWHFVTPLDEDRGMAMIGNMS